MYHMYEIISAMQSLYGNLLHYGEQWSADTRDWLLRMLRQKMSLPIEEPELLMAVIQCLTRYYSPVLPFFYSPHHALLVVKICSSLQRQSMLLIK